MLQWAAIFLVIAIVAALFGFGGFVAGAVSIAKIFFILFLVGAVVMFLLGRRSV